MTASRSTRHRPGLFLRILRHPLAVAAIAYISLLTILAIGAPWLAPHPPNSTDLDMVLASPSRDHLLGTDQLGRDVLSRLMWGGQVSLVGVAQAVGVVLAMGVPLGLIAGYVGGWVDWLISRVIDIALAIPAIVFLLMVLAVFGSNQTVAMVALGFLGAPDVARIVRGATLSVRNELYISAARVSGVPASDIVVRQVLPAVTGPIVVRAALFAGGALLAQSGLSFLGLGVQPPAPTWGGMVAEASIVIARSPWLLVPSGVTIGLAILAFGLLGNAARDASQERYSKADSRRAAKRAAPIAPAPGVSPEPADATQSGDSPLLGVRDLIVSIDGDAGPVRLTDSVRLEVRKGEIVGLVGESGCGKSITGKAILGILPVAASVVSGSTIFDGVDLTQAGERAYWKVRGKRIALISQEPTASLDPSYRVGAQLGEFIRRHDGGDRRAVKARVRELLEMVNLPDPDSVAAKYPHELSGGMAQRVAIAIALSGRPELLIADEPTTALDVTVQAEILNLLRRLQEQSGMSVLMITHDWGVVADLCQRAYVMYAGQVVESAPVVDLFDSPKHPYTVGLLNSTPQPEDRGRPLTAVPGTVPPPGTWQSGCRFAPRCPIATPECSTGSILMTTITTSQRARCIHTDRVRKETASERPNAAQGA